MIELIGLCAGYDGSPILRDICLTFPRGQVTVLLGPNGCGKSTLLKALLGMAQVQAGQIRVDGRLLESYDPQTLARRISYLPQTRRVPDMTVEQLVLHGRFPYLRYPRRYRPEDRAIAREAMEQAGIAGLAGTPVTRLSGGTRQKAYIAMTLAQNTQTLLLDEPNTYLDIAHQLQLMTLCRDLAAKGKAVVLVLHDLELAMEYAHRIALFHSGTLLAEGTPDEIFESGALDQAFGVKVSRYDTPDGRRYGCRISRKEL